MHPRWSCPGKTPRGAGTTWTCAAKRARRADWERTPDSARSTAFRRRGSSLPCGGFLLAANSPPSAWQTAKCGVWAEETEPAENLYDAGFTHSSYVDLVLAEPAAELRGNLEAHRAAGQRDGAEARSR